MAVIEIQVVFDFLCAWCYIGKRNLDRAISLYQKTYPGGRSDTFAITWSPYYLEYNKAPYSVDKTELAETRLAHLTPKQRAALTLHMNRAGRAAGINFMWGGRIGPDTREAHRLVRLGSTKSSEIRDAIVEGLLDAYQAREQDISERGVLRAVAVKAGIDGAEVDAWLDSDADADVVDEEARKNKEIFGEEGVPAFVIQGVNRLNGAQDPLDLVEVFIKVREGQ
ncbi:DSBA-like thioredoxin domain-containing protein [Daldinia childiae]|uniref:DSBA-like thioredoxin domain-containing protein n=1 Tax=Daldinia childiae TaxID=326645 RepID=UPI001447BD3B|nr:DSBA-like thioredoxin domain-containing protein [Daldinia childiae]KAF3069696.1 DSBA-like thioredoxin domain-containing protein [Daldinia childiae]